MVKEIALAMAGTERAGAMSFEELLAAFERPILRLCYRLLGNLADAQDAAQDVFLKAHRNLAKLDAGRDPLPWLYHVAVNQCRDRMRRRRPSVEFDETRAREGGLDPEEQAGAAERKRIVMEGLACLTERERTAIVLRELEGLETSEVARIMEVTEETVRSQCSTARTRLKQYVDGRIRR